jgi:nitroreductase
LMQILKARKSVRAFGPEKLPPQVCSNLLWAAHGINRADGKRTSPTGWNKQEMDIYVATDEGLFLYEPKPHGLKRILKEDIRAVTGTQPYVKTAPVNLIYVADFSRMAMPTKSFPTLGDEEEKAFLSAAASGCIAQNVYLYCISEGLVTAVRSLIDRPALAKVMNIRADQRITLAQAVGYPKK